MVLVNCQICHQKKGAKLYSDYKKSPTIPDDICVGAFTEKKIYRCESCESCFVYPSIDDNELDNFYSALYSKSPQKFNFYHKLFPYQNSRYLSQVVYLKNFLNIFKNMQVLEIGSNITSILPALSFLSERIDFFYFDQVESPVIKKYGGRRVGAFADPESIRQKIKEGSLDLIHMSHTLEHISPCNLTKMLQQCYSALKRKGYVFIEVPFQLEIKNFYPPHTLFFSATGIRSLFESIGFKIINLQLTDVDPFFTDHKNTEAQNLSTSMKKLVLIWLLCA